MFNFIVLLKDLIKLIFKLIIIPFKICYKVTYFLSFCVQIILKLTFCLFLDNHNYVKNYGIRQFIRDYRKELSRRSIIDGQGFPEVCAFTSTCFAIIYVLHILVTL